MIDVEGLVLERPWGRALDGVGFVARTGVATAVVGPPGSGKTSLLRCLATLDAPQAGRIRLAGVDPARDPAAAHARLGYVAQGFGLYDAMSVRRCLDHAARMRGLSPQQAADAVETAAARVGLAGGFETPAGALGEADRLRLALAQATVHDPKVLLLDEPMSGLGPFARAEIAALIESRARAGATVMVAALSLAFAQGCTDLLRLEAGRTVGEGVQRDGARALPEPGSSPPLPTDRDEAS